MVISSLAEGVTRSVENIGDAVSGAFFEPVIRLGVTGLARAGKTVFITSLVANLLERERMAQLSAARSGRIEAAYLRPQPDVTVPRFDYEAHFAALTGDAPHWPRSTRRVSELRLSFKVQPNGLLGGIQGPRTVHLDIVDYPGEWLLDLGLLDQSYAEWSEKTLTRIAKRDVARDYLGQIREVRADTQLEEPEMADLAAGFTAYLQAARDEGFSDCTPGRFLLPGDLEGSPVLTFAPLRKPEKTPRGSLYRLFEQRFEAYKSKVVKPFFREHFARIDRQIVLVDVLGAMSKGPAAVEDLRLGLSDILSAFRPGRNAFLSRLMMGRRVDRILFAATKADHLHHSQHDQLAGVMQALTRDARDRAQFAGARTEAVAMASLRATTEVQKTHDGRTLNLVQGRLLEDGRQVAYHPGVLPDDPARVLARAREGAPVWSEGAFEAMRFAPARLERQAQNGLPHIRLDRAAEFLIGDRL